MYTQLDTPIGAPLATEKTSQWFSAIIASFQGSYSISIDAPTFENINLFLAKLIDGSGDTDELYSQMHDVSSAHFVSKMWSVYLEELKSREVKLNHLAFDYSHSKVLVWVEVADNDEATMDQLILAEAKANAYSYDKLVYISTTLVEKSDHIPVPPHYVLFQFSKN